MSQAVSAQNGGYNSQTTYTWTAQIDSGNRTYAFDLPASPYGLQTEYLVVGISYDCLWRFDIKPDDTYIQYVGNGTYDVELDQSFDMYTTPSGSNVVDGYGDDTAWNIEQINVWPVTSGGVCTNYIQQRGDVLSAVFPYQANAYASTPHKLYITGSDAASTANWFVYGQPMDSQQILADYYVNGIPNWYAGCSISASYTENLTVSATYYGSLVPEPSSLLALFGGLASLAGIVRIRR
jgi:hypothetical protein